MKLVSLTICRNSAWSIEAAIGHALQYVDSAVVLCHACTDDTVSVLREFDERVTIMKTVDDAWDEMYHRQITLNYGRELGGTHFVILDDDEFLTQSMVPHFRGAVENLKPGQVMRQPLRCCWRSLDQYRDDRGNPFSNCWKSVAFCDKPELFWHDDNGYQHHHTHPYNSVPVNWSHRSGGGWMHIQHANWRRLVAKQTWYMMMELCRYGKVIANYRGTMDERGLHTAPVPDEWWSAEHRAKLRLDDEPWQVRDMLRMLNARGVEYFLRNGVDPRPILKEYNVQPE